MTNPFPQSPDFVGFNEPSRIECDINDLVVEGKIPDEIDGTWYRLTPDPMYPPLLGNDILFAGDGAISMFRFKNGRVDYKTRYVMTDRLKNDMAAGRSLYGLYRNPYTDDPSVEGTLRGVANTTPVLHGGKLLALKEDSLPMEVDPNTLETKGWVNYDGKLRTETFTAHPRVDFDSGEMFFFGYEAGGLATRDISYGVVDANGRLIKEEWFEAPYVPWAHDFVVTQEHIIFPFFPTTADLERIKAGGCHWLWEPEQLTRIAIMPRNGTVKDLRWFTGPAVSAYHFMNGYTEGNKVYMDFSYAKTHQFPFVREASGIKEFDPADLQCPYVRWEFDLSKPGDGWEEYVLCPAVGDFPRIADKDHMKDYDVGYYINYDPNCGPPLMTGAAYFGFNCLTRMEVKSGKSTQFSLGPGTTVNEPIHVPSQQAGHEGYLIYVTDLHEEWKSDVLVLDAGNIEKGPLARIKLPLRLRNQVHGMWYSADKISG